MKKLKYANVFIKIISIFYKKQIKLIEGWDIGYYIIYKTTYKKIFGNKYQIKFEEVVNPPSHHNCKCLSDHFLKSIMSI
jgi:hypothetical protein